MKAHDLLCGFPYALRCAAGFDRSIPPEFWVFPGYWYSGTDYEQRVLETMAVSGRPQGNPSRRSPLLPP